ncbi:hypothetical protein IP65_17965 [Novosphingobium sp. AAP1]|uniref:hypothetical protein n=1 Tax=Novosphingobium sp. AAP1 TaxID=1523413 RepID=UPI0006B8DDEC|nr:hypothetical protein [Novosphingobium sp. AAP1]KPF52077.1 hypothetical protein IP65_17965 [Novosphingobium sp. AAP1]
MTTIEPDLAEMLETLAALGTQDRGFVLARMPAPSRRQAERFLAERQASRPSAGLIKLVEVARRGTIPAGMTQAAAAALAAVPGDDPMAAESDSKPGAAVGSAAWLDRVLGALRGRGR